MSDVGKLLDQASDRIEERWQPFKERLLSREDATRMVLLSAAGSGVDGRELAIRLNLDLNEWRDRISDERCETVEDVEAILRGFLLRTFWLGYVACEIANEEREAELDDGRAP